VQAIVVGVSAIATLSAAALAATAALAPILAPDQRVSWALFGFEVVVFVAGLLGILTGLNCFREGPGLALACIAGTIIVASGLGWQGSGRAVAGIGLTPVLGARILISFALALLGVWVVLSRSRESWRPAVVGGCCLLVVLAGLGAIVHPATRQAVAGGFSGSSGLSLLLVVLGFGLMCALLSAGAHLLIRAFESGRTEERRS
jgi:hypothetical protein